MEKLRAYLKDNEITQGDFGCLIGATQSYVSKILSGDKTPKLEVAVKISRVTDGAVPVESWLEQTA